jgi:Holliday junction resolvase RusA-like endonuclease
MRTIEFFVGGVPEGRPRPRACRRGNHASVYAVKAKGGFEDRIACVANLHRPTYPLEGPIKVLIGAQWEWPKATSKKRMADPMPAWKTGKPDADNVAKAVLDVLTACGFWLDDAQVADLRVLKGVGHVAGTQITIRQMELPDAPRT